MKKASASRSSPRTAPSRPMSMSRAAMARRSGGAEARKKRGAAGSNGLSGHGSAASSSRSRRSSSKRGAAHSAAYEGPLAKSVAFVGETLRVDLTDGRRVFVPLEFYPTLLVASPRERRDWNIIGGVAVNGNQLDFQLSADGIVAGRRECLIRPGFRSWLAAEQKRLGLERIGAR